MLIYISSRQEGFIKTLIEDLQGLNKKPTVKQSSSNFTLENIIAKLSLN